MGFSKRKILLFAVGVSFCFATLLVAANRDQFPGRRQGGGSRGYLPAPNTSLINQ